MCSQRNRLLIYSFRNRRTIHIWSTTAATEASKATDRDSVRYTINGFGMLPDLNRAVVDQPDIL